MNLNIMRQRIIFFLLIFSSILRAQELRQTDYEKGYVKDGKRYSVWQYFNSKKEVELAINHTSGKVMYIIQDTSDYVIFKDGEWGTSKLDVHPIPITGSYNFYEKLSKGIDYPDITYVNRIEGKIIVLFDVDTLGNSVNFKIINHLSPECDSAVLQCLKKTNQKWIPARVDSKKYSSRFALKIDFRLKIERSTADQPLTSVKAKIIEKEIVVTITPDHVFTFVDKSAEPVFGLPEFYRWIGSNLQYPENARHSGLQGKVFVKFIIEPTGAITNGEIVKGLSEECDKEVLRVISIAANWQPAIKDGRAVRQAYTLPIAFKLGR
jgi:TonB family protein